MEILINHTCPMPMNAPTAPNEPPPATTGRMIVDGNDLFYTLELPDGDPRRVPDGRYEAVKYASPKFQPELAEMRIAYPQLMGWMPAMPNAWLLRLNRPPHDEQFDEVHCGNTAANVKGCCIIGLQKPNPRMILQSREALADLLSMANKAFNAGEKVWITISSPAPQMVTDPEIGM